MSRKILDSSTLISWWRKRASETANITLSDARRWGDKLAEDYGTDLIVSPVYLEFLVHARSSDLVFLYEEFLNAFTVLDQWTILEADFAEARRLAKRVPPDGQPRQLGDCLIKALANRYRCEVATGDKRFPK